METVVEGIVGYSFWFANLEIHCREKQNYKKKLSEMAIKKTG